MWCFRPQNMLVKLKTKESWYQEKHEYNGSLEYYITVAKKLFCLQLYNIIQE